MILLTDYQRLYTHLFNQVTDCIELLKQAQIEAEEQYLKMDDSPSPAESPTNNTPPLQRP